MPDSDEIIREIPEPLAMVICDQVITEAKTNKKTLVGTFNIIAAKRFPVVHPKLAVFIAISGGNGDYAAKLQFIPESGGAPIVSLQGPIRFQNPLAVVEIAFEILNLRIDEPGIYSLELHCDDALVICRRIEVKAIP